MLPEFVLKLEVILSFDDVVIRGKVILEANLTIFGHSCKYFYMKNIIVTSSCIFCDSLQTIWAVLVIRSACSPSTPTIRVQIMLSLQFYSEVLFEKSEIKLKRGRGSPI